MTKEELRKTEEFAKALTMLDLIKIHHNMKQYRELHPIPTIYDEVKEKIPDLTDSQVNSVVELIEDYR